MRHIIEVNRRHKTAQNGVRQQKAAEGSRRQQKAAEGSRRQQKAAEGSRRQQKAAQRGLVSIQEQSRNKRGTNSELKETRKEQKQNNFRTKTERKQNNKGCSPVVFLKVRGFPVLRCTNSLFLLQAPFRFSASCVRVIHSPILFNLVFPCF